MLYHGNKTIKHLGAVLDELKTGKFTKQELEFISEFARRVVTASDNVLKKIKEREEKKGL